MSNPNATTRRNQFILVGLLLVGITALVGAGMFLFDGQAPTSREKTKAVSITPPGTVDDKDVWRANEAARAKANETTIAEMQAKLRTQDEANKKLEKAMEDMKLAKSTASSTPAAAIQNASVLSSPLPATPQRVLASPNLLPASAKSGSPPAPGILNTPLNGNAAPAEKIEAVEMITFTAAPGTAAGTGSATPPQDKSDKTTAIEFIPAGSFMPVAMLNGVDAPTGGQAQGNPLPIAFHVLDTANLANKYKLDIQDCRFIASAWGDLSSERTMARTETLTCIIDGDTVEIPVKGIVIGEDGKAGMRGRLVTKQGQILANALFAGALSGIGKAIQSASTTTSISGGGITQTVDPGQVAQAGIGGGVGSAANSLAQYYIKQADKLFPVIETDGGRTVEILITKGAVYHGKSGSRDQYRSLLSRSGSNSRRNEDDED